MSRKKVENENYQIIYGEDDIDGLFIQVFDRGEDLVYSMDASENPHMNVEHIVEMAEEYGFNLSDELIEETIE